MTTALLSLFLSAAHPVHAHAVPTDFDLADMASTRTVDTDGPQRFLIGEVDAPPAEPRATLRVRGAKVKLRVPIG